MFALTPLYLQNKGTLSLFSSIMAIVSFTNRCTFILSSGLPSLTVASFTTPTNRGKPIQLPFNILNQDGIHILALVLLAESVTAPTRKQRKIQNITQV